MLDKNIRCVSAQTDDRSRPWKRTQSRRLALLSPHEILAKGDVILSIQSSFEVLNLRPGEICTGGSETITIRQ